MSSEQLMQQARDIETTAAEVEYRQLCRAAGRGAVAIDYGKIQAKYQNRAQPLFEPFTRIPDPRSYNGAIEYLESAMGYLSSGYQSTDPITKRGVNSNGDLDAIKSASGELIDWQGEGATKFKTNFLDPLPSKVTNQFLVLCLMNGAAEADRKVWERTERDIEGIATDTLHALDNVLSSGSGDVKFTLSVIATVVSIAAIPLTGGASMVAAGLGAVGSAAGTAAQVPQYVNGSGGSPESIVQAMEDAIGKLTSQIREKQGQIAQMLSAYAGEVNQNKGNPPTPYIARRPKLAGMEGKELTTSEGIGKPKWGIE